MERRSYAGDRSVWANGFGAASVLVTLACVLAVAGMLYETIARSWARNEIPAPGQMVQLGDRRVHLDCRGTGSPTVLFESGLDVLGSLAWSRVHAQIAKTTRACAYDRAGFVWSDPQHSRRDATAVALELRAILARADEPGPYLLVGHAVGGLYTLVFTALEKEAVRGLVLLDSAHPEQRLRFQHVLAEGGRELPAWLRVANRLWRALGPFWATVGVVRLLGVELPPDVDDESARIANAFGPTSREAIWAEEAAFEATLREAGAVHDLGDRFLTVLTADPPTRADDEQEASVRETWLQLQREMATWSTRGQHAVVPGAHHHIQLGKPAAVVKAVNAMVADIRRELPDDDSP